MSEAPSRATSRRGRTLKLYLVDGSPSGVITAELGISSVRAAVASRTALPDLIRREEASRTGIYLLVGPDPDLPGRQLVYVGEGDQVRTRLAAHDADEAKDFFTRAVLIVSKGRKPHQGAWPLSGKPRHCRYSWRRPCQAGERHGATVQGSAGTRDRGHGAGARRDRGAASGAGLRHPAARRPGSRRGIGCVCEVGSGQAVRSYGGRADLHVHGVWCRREGARSERRIRSAGRIVCEATRGAELRRAAEAAPG